MLLCLVALFLGALLDFKNYFWKLDSHSHGQIFGCWQRRDIRKLTAARYSDAGSGEIFGCWQRRDIRIWQHRDIRMLAAAWYSDLTAPRYSDAGSGVIFGCWQRWDIRTLTEARYSDADSSEKFGCWQCQDIRMLTAARYSDADSGESAKTGLGSMVWGMRRKRMLNWTKERLAVGVVVVHVKLITVFGVGNKR